MKESTKKAILSGVRLLAMFTILLLPVGCATKIPVNMLQPAEFHQASLTKTVAVVPFSGRGGVEFGAELEGLLAGIDLHGKPYFTLVDRASIDKVISEMKFSQSALVDPGTAVRLGKLVGAQGIYTGTVTANGTRDSYFTERRSECAQRQMKRDKDGNLSEGNCIRWRNYNVNCTKRQANYSVTPKLVEVATAKIVYSKNVVGTADSSGCEDRKPPLSEQELLDKARESVKTSIRRDIAPYYITAMISLKDSTDGIQSQEAKDRLSSGISYAEKNRLDAACEKWGEARQFAPNSPSILYNLGVCAESIADVENAYKLYKQADKLIGQPDDEITLALNRVNTALNNQKKLKEQMK